MPADPCRKLVYRALADKPVLSVILTPSDFYFLADKNERPDRRTVRRRVRYGYTGGSGSGRRGGASGAK